MYDFLKNKKRDRFGTQQRAAMGISDIEIRDTGKSQTISGDLWSFVYLEEKQWIEGVQKREKSQLLYICPQQLINHGIGRSQLCVVLDRFALCIARKRRMAQAQSHL